MSRFARFRGLRMGSFVMLAAVHCGGAAVPRPPSTPDEVARDRAAALLAPTPPMGWSSWNKFGCHVTDAIIRTAADAMVTSGMRDAGYEYVNIDDCWNLPERVNGHLQPDPRAFPEGLAPVAAYVHARGLKLGIYSDHGSATCEKRAASHGYEDVDAADFEAWGVDYLKYDNCNEVSGASQADDYRAMSRALASRRRPIVFSICAWKYADWMPSTGNLWRTAGDIRDTWESITHVIDVNVRYAAVARPGRWNDPDSLEVGNGGMTDDEYRAHFSMWALMAAPLIAGNDLVSIDEATRAILMNREVIAVDQDRLGLQGTRVSSHGGREVYVRTLAGGARAVVLLNRSRAPASMGFTWAEAGLPSGTLNVRDLWRHETMGAFRGRYDATVPPHGAVMLRLGDPGP